MRNDNHYPKSSKDGTIVCNSIILNQYKDDWFEDKGLTNNHIYYYRFFTYSTEDVEFSSPSMILSIEPISYDTVLQNNSWDTISKIANYNAAKYIWNIGDEKLINFSGMLYKRGHTQTDTFAMQIWDFDHYDKIDGSGKAGIVFGLKQVIPGISPNGNADLNFFYQAIDENTWKTCKFRLETCPLILTSLPIDLQSLIKPVYTEEFNAILDRTTGEQKPKLDIIRSEDKVFLPSLGEIIRPNYVSSRSCGQLLQYFTDENNIQKKCYNDHNIDSPRKYLTRTVAYWQTTSIPFSVYIIDWSIGTRYSTLSDYIDQWYANSTNIAFCFCV